MEKSPVVAEELNHHPAEQNSSTHHHIQNEDREDSYLMHQQKQQPRRPSLTSLEIPSRSLENTLSNFTRIDIPPSPTSSSTKGGLPPRPSSAKFRSSVRNLLPQRSFRGKNISEENDINCDKTVLIIPNTPISDKPMTTATTTPRSFSLNKVFFSSSTKTAHSLPVTPVAESVQQNHLDRNSEIQKGEVHHHMTRSFSVPVNVKNKSLRRSDSSGALIRVLPATPRPSTANNASPDNLQDPELACGNAGEDIPEEEAICRICFVELKEGGETLKMECSCKGDLALAHQECALKWFSIKGNKTCDVCKQDVKNLPVTLLKIQTPRSTTTRRHQNVVPQQREIARYRVWQDVPVLVMVSMLAYFCFLEQLLVSDMGSRALAISLPFACALGLLSTMIASTMVSKSYIWAYASFQFAIVILFAHIFYAVLNVNSILSVLLSSFTGFGIAISTNSLLVEYLRWRASRRHFRSSLSPQQVSNGGVMLQHQNQIQTQNQLQFHPSHHQQQQLEREQELRENVPVVIQPETRLQEVGHTTQ